MSNHSKSYTITRTVFVAAEMVETAADERTFSTREQANAARAAWIAEDASKITSDYGVTHKSHSTIAYQTHPGEMGEPIVRCRAEYDVMHTAMALATIAMKVA